MTNKLALYFGCIGWAGHCLYEPGERQVEPGKFDGLGRDYGLLDGGLLRNRRVPDAPDGRVHWTFGGRPITGNYWHSFFWWDRSVDRRDACNSGFYVRGFGPPDQWLVNARAAFEFACATWPRVVARQQHPLLLVCIHGTDQAIECEQCAKERAEREARRA